MLKKITLNFKQISLFPILTTSPKSNMCRKIYAKHWLYCFCLTEIGIDSNIIKIKFSRNRLNVCRSKNATQTLRSPNRHKVAQFHTTKKFFETISTIQILFKRNNIKTSFYFVNFIFSIFLAFESSSVYLKNLKIQIHQNVVLNTIK